MRCATIKLALLTAGSMFFASQVFALAETSKIVIDGRADYLSQMYDDEEGSPTVRSDNATFQVTGFRADFMGKLGQKPGYRLRLNFPNSANTKTTPAPADQVTNFIDYAWVSYMLADNITLMGGKQWTGNGGIVGLYDPNDVYMYPKAFLELVNNSAINGNNRIYATGFGAMGVFGPHKVWLNATTPGASTVDQTNGTTSNNNTTAFSGRWLGAFMDGKLLPTVTYSTEGRQNSTASDKKLKYDYASIGLKFTIPMIDVEADYLMNNYKDKTTAGEKDETKSAYVLVRYKTEQFRPFVTFESSTQETKTSATVTTEVKTTAFGLGVEYYPAKEDDFRFHAVFTDSKGETSITSATGTDQKQQQIIVGMKIKADLLK